MSFSAAPEPRSFQCIPLQSFPSPSNLSGFSLCTVALFKIIPSAGRFLMGRYCVKPAVASLQAGLSQRRGQAEAGVSEIRFPPGSSVFTADLPCSSRLRVDYCKEEGRWAPREYERRTRLPVVGAGSSAEADVGIAICQPNAGFCNMESLSKVLAGCS